VAISALDENGKPVDWWFVYKVPEMGGVGPGAAKGYEYAYYDPNVGKVLRSPYQLSADKGALDVTLDSIFNTPSNTTGWILYNDEMPDASKKTPTQSDNGSLGHTKGVLAFDTATRSALWLLHSWPKYAMPGEKTMPTPKYGQTYLCVTIDLDTASHIAQIMCDHQEPQVFASRLPDVLGATDPLRLLAGPINPNAPGDSHVLDFQSRGGKAFKLIAKNRKWGGDFWNQLVGPALGVCIDVETWIRGRNVIPSEKDSDAPGKLNLLGEHETFDIKTIDLTPLGMPWKWPETKDHAKWGIGVEADWVCVGDINRMISQEKRGGGAIAFQDQALWAALKQTDSINPGPSKTGTRPPPLPATTTTSTAIPSKVTPPAKPSGPHPKTTKPAATRATAKKPTAKKPAAKKPAARKLAARKPVAKKPAVRKQAAKRPAANKQAARKPAAKRSAARKKPAGRKAAVRKSAGRAARKRPVATPTRRARGRH
jgi:deoxyribonuclease-2